ncbi:hypothetical protein TNCV_983381 [Trichonephila clavipes]|nr:hypothetical protein TNCV_983381 [Trichonephila clavipes]
MADKISVFKNLLDCGEATSFKILLNRIQSLEEQICQLNSPQIKNIVLVPDPNFFFAARLVHGIEYGKLQSAVNIATNSAAEDYKACRKFRLFVKDRTTNLHFLVDSGADCSIIPATSKINNHRITNICSKRNRKMELKC